MSKIQWHADVSSGKIRIVQPGGTLAAFSPKNTSGLRAFCRCNSISEITFARDMRDDLKEIVRFALEPTPDATDDLGTAPQVEPMADIDFWTLVECVQWWSGHDYNQGKQRLVRRLHTAERCQAFREAYDRMRFLVSEAISEYEVEHDVTLPVGGDSYEDLVAHIVGLGWAGYENALSNPGVIFRKAEAGDYRESFSYCVPFPEDFLVSAWTAADRQRHRDRHVERCVNDIRGSVETLLRAHLEECPALYHSPLAYEIDLEVSAAVKKLLGKDS